MLIKIDLGELPWLVQLLFCLGGAAQSWGIAHGEYKGEALVAVRLAKRESCKGDCGYCSDSGPMGSSQMVASCLSFQ